MSGSADYQAIAFNYTRSPDQDRDEPAHHGVVVVGAGPVGLATAIDLAQQGVAVLLLDDDDRLSTGYRAICFAKRTLEIFDRLGCGEKMVSKGVTWNVGKVFFHEEPVYSFNLLPKSGHHRPAFINMQQYYVEGYLLDRAQELPNIEIRWKNKAVGVTPSGSGIQLRLETPDGPYSLGCDWLVAADGARSPNSWNTRTGEQRPRVRDRFLIADVKMTADFPAERWFWFDPPFHPNQSVLLHQQPDGVWRIDFQLGWDADPVAERQPDKVIPRVQALLGKDTKFELEWVSCTPSPVFAWSISGTDACSSPETARMASLRLGLVAPIAVCRMRRIWRGNSVWSPEGLPRIIFSIPTTPSAFKPPMRIS